MLETTIAGGPPKPAWLAEPEKLWAPWRLTDDALIAGQRDAALVALKEQEMPGIDIVSNGEQLRQHFVHGILEHVTGIDFDKRVRMVIRADRYEAEVPTVTGPIGRAAPSNLRRRSFAGGACPLGQGYGCRHGGGGYSQGAGDLWLDRKPTERRSQGDRPRFADRPGEYRDARRAAGGRERSRRRHNLHRHLPARVCDSPGVVAPPARTWALAPPRWQAILGCRQDA